MQKIALASLLYRVATCYDTETSGLVGSVILAIVVAEYQVDLTVETTAILFQNAVANGESEVA
jgi:hypothetical protein